MAKYRIKSYRQLDNSFNYYVQKKWWGMFWYNFTFKRYRGSWCQGDFYYNYETRPEAEAMMEAIKKGERK